MITEKNLLLKNLETDRSYQSPVNENQVFNIVKNFDPKAVGRIDVSEREDGSYYIVDGQHRVVALMRLGHQRIKCAVYKRLSVKDEAEMYRKINDRKMKSANNFAKADLRSGVKYAVEIDDAVNRAGFVVDYELNGPSSNALKPYKTFRTIYNNHGAEHLFNVLYIGRQIFGGTYEEIQGWTLKGLSDFLSMYSDLDEKRLLKSMESVSFRELKKLVNQKKNETGESPAKSLPFVLVDVYNKRLSKSKRLDAMKLLI